MEVSEENVLETRSKKYVKKGDEKIENESLDESRYETPVLDDSLISITEPQTEVNKVQDTTNIPTTSNQNMFGDIMKNFELSLKTYISQTQSEIHVEMENIKKEFDEKLNIPKNTNIQNVRYKLYDLPSFDGKPENWPIFYTSFYETTKAYNYSNLDNSIRLRKCLCGKALDVVQAMLIHPDNVPEVIEELKFRFGRPELLVKSQIEKIRQFSKIKDEDITEFLNFSTKLKNLVAFLKNADASQYLQNPALLEELYKKLPLSRQLQWAEYQSNLKNFPSIIDFCEWISKVARIASFIETSDTASNNIQNKSITKRTMVANVITIKCPMCSEEHYLKECSKFKKMSVSDRWEQIKKIPACFSCLRKGHRANDCWSKKKCNIDSCKFKHHYLLHESVSNQNDQRKNTTSNCINPDAVNNSKQSLISTPSSILNIHDTNENVYFRVVPVIISTEEKALNTYALLDEGSSSTIMDLALIEELGLNGRKLKFTTQWLTDEITETEAVVVDCFIQGVTKGCQRYQLKNVHGWRNLNLPCQSIQKEKLSALYPQLNGLEISNYSNAKPRVLIGLDNARLGYPKNYVDCLPSGPIAIQTSLGWVLYGSVSSEKPRYTNQVLFVQNIIQRENHSEFEKLNEKIKNYYELENFGSERSSKVIQSAESTRAIKILEESTVYSKMCYETGLLWKNDDIKLPHSFSMALGRLRNLECKMNKNPEYEERYCKAVDEFFKKGYARRLTPEEAKQESNKTWYLPHFGVENINKPGKIRLVFDAAAISNGISLNSQLLKGPDLNQTLISVLCKFREGSIGVCGDIKEMFSQVKIKNEDRQAQRFLWRNECDKTVVDICEMTSMIFGATSSPTTAQYIKNVNALKYKNEMPEACNTIIYNHYVDDLVKSFWDEETAISTISQVKFIHAQANFDLCHFRSNSNQILKALGLEEQKNQNMMNFNKDQGLRKEKVLGMYWDSSSDEFTFEFKFHKIPEEVLQQIRPPTKREILSMTMSIFDPYGYLGNVHIYAKILLQSLWNIAMSWDSALPTEETQKWFKWQSLLGGVSNIKVSRWYNYLPDEVLSIELHVFVDASMVAYAAVSYWRIVYPDKIKVSFIFGKARVAPRRVLSIPRMELLAAVLGVRMKEAVVENHTIRPNKICLWSDSKTLLNWVHSDSRDYKPFVAHRISEILEFSEENSWYWLPTSMNVADDATRAKLPDEITSESRWIQGPQFLKEKVLIIPQQPTNLRKSEIPDECRKQTEKILLLNDYSNAVVPIFDRFSKYLKLKRVMAWVFRAVKIFLNMKTNEITTNSRKELTIEELDSAEKYLCRVVQQQQFSKDYQLLKSKLPISNQSVLYNLNPYLESDDLIRVQGRIDAASEIPLTARRPIILPKNNKLTLLIIYYYHEKYLHANHEIVICKIREKFWVPHIRHQLRTVCHQCQRCKINRAKPKQPMMGQLPYDRLAAFQRPFTYTGLDYFGPIHVIVGRSTQKRWVALFTCLTTRAIHLELSTDLSTDACILCLRNFVNLRGVPKRIRSDNGTNFVGLQKELNKVPELFDINKFEQEMSSRGIKWIFNTPYDPSAGGVWERLVQSVKRSLNAVLKERTPREDVMRSLLLEVTNIVNSRPLTHIPVLPDEEEPLTPNHFLMGEVNSSQTPEPPNDRLMYLRKQWRICQQLKNHFYQRWIKEYLPTLTRRSKWLEKAPLIKVGDIVIICEVELPRSKWVKGKVVEVHQSRDGQVRSAEVKTSSGTLRRPANRLAVLDVVNPGDSREGEC